MALDRIADRVIDTDVLVVGGGIGGCPSAAKMAEQGLRVTLVEKSKTDRSGNAAKGMDHYGVFPRGISVLEAVDLWQKGRHAGVVNGPGRFIDPNVDYVQFANAFYALDELERLGIPMRWDDGELYWIPHQIHVRGLKLGLRVHWERIKPTMAKMVRDKGVNVLDRVMLVDLLTNDGKVVGASGIDTRTGEFVVIKAAAVVMASGMFCRCYDPEGPLSWKYKFNYHYCPATTSGDGWAVAYRAGAGLAHMDLNAWGFRNRDNLTISFGSFVSNDGIPSKVFSWNGEESHTLARITPRGFDEAERAGLTPMYQSIEHLPDDFQKRLEVAFADESLIALKLAQDRGFNPRTHRYEFMTNKPLQMMLLQGIHVTDDFQSALKGLYAIGDCASGVGGCHGAVISGMVVADSMRNAVSDAGEPVIDEGQVESQKQSALAPLKVKDGTEPMELECAVRYICERYVGTFKSEGKLREGMRRLDSLKREFVPKLMATNPHYLMRCLEVRNIIELAEVHMQACMSREETRGSFIRLDYPDMDPARDSIMTHVRMENGRPLLELLEIPPMKPERLKGGE
jgi:succinate dehydrogenase/fumarate reductase flavoprotein subunit